LVFVVLILGSCILGFLLSGYNERSTGDGVNWAGVHPEAKDVKYYIPRPFAPMGSAEFTIDYNGYVKWVDEWKRTNEQLSDISLGSTLVYRYNIKYGKFERIEIPNAAISSWSYTDQGLHLVYDKDSGRAYYWMTTR
jgi:hypothetical protein